MVTVLDLDLHTMLLQKTLIVLVHAAGKNAARLLDVLTNRWRVRELFAPMII